MNSSDGHIGANKHIIPALLAPHELFFSANKDILYPLLAPGADMLTPKKIMDNQNFIGRSNELEDLKQIGNAGEASIIVVYGRRRVGKTELLEQAFRDRNILKFEGIENAPHEQQMHNVLWQFSIYANDPLLAKLNMHSWKEIFKLIADKTQIGTWTIYLEELQWLANYNDELISELKYIWDNFFRYNKNLLLILCGSSPSFMINQVLKSKALYNRTQHELPLKEFNLLEAKQLLTKRSNREVMDAYLSVGGIPDYLKRLQTESSIFLALCKNSFKKGGYFAHEADRIFASSMSEKKYYKPIVEYLGKVKFATRNEILKFLRIKSSGKMSELLTDLELCGFIRKYSPYNLGEDSKLIRYAIDDTYLQFYYKFIKPHLNKINNADFNDSPTRALNLASLQKWSGFAFERFCRKNHYLIARILGFSAVNYESGVYFSKETNEVDPKFQIDLLFMRDDKVCTICEIKYLQTKVDTSVIDEIEKKITLLNLPRRYSQQRVLITTEGASQALIARAYFDRIIILDDLFNYNNYK